MRKYILKYKWKIGGSVILFIVIIPALINWLFKQAAPSSFFVAEWGAGDVLAFYSAMLAAVTAILGVYISIEYAQRNYRIDEANRVKPYLALTHYKAHSQRNLFLEDEDVVPEDKVEQPKSRYEEYKLEKTYIVIDRSGIHFKDKLSKSQQQQLRLGGIEWKEKDGVRYTLQARTLVSIPFEVENVGSGAATNTMIAFYQKGDEPRGINFYTMKQGDSFYFHIFCDNAEIVIGYEYIIELHYGDIIGNDYSQKYPVEFGRDTETNRFRTTVNLTGKQENVEKNEGGK